MYSLFFTCGIHLEHLEHLEQRDGDPFPYDSRLSVVQMRDNIT